jgi:trimethylamine--corrinoid protein Co-methyltransferase
MDNGMVCSTAQLVLGNENIGMTKRFIRGIEVSSETLTRELIEKVGPGGHYLDQDHTFEHFRKELWMPGLMTRSAYEDWQSQGAKDIASRIQEKLEDIVENYKAPSLPDKISAALQAIRSKGEKELVKS